MDDKAILYDSDEAAKPGSCAGWFSSLGHFFKSEHDARRDGCTHVRCTCGTFIHVGRTRCSSCQNMVDIQRYDELEKKEWDGKGMLYSEAAQEFFSDWGEIEEYAEDEQTSIDDLRLIICEPRYLQEVELSYWEDELSTSDGDEIDAPNEILQALGELNKVIRKTGPVSWTPGKFAVKINQ